MHFYISKRVIFICQRVAISYEPYTYSNSVKYVESEVANSIHKVYTLLKWLQLNASG